MSRYDNQTIKKDLNGTQYLNTIEYPKVPLRDDDLFIQGMYGQRLDNLAHKYYGNTEQWWIIDRANVGHTNGSLYMNPNKEYRIPTNITRIIREFEELND